MKILHLETGRHLYGGARQVGYLIDALAKRGIDNLLVCAEGHALAAHVDAEVFEWRLGGDFDRSLRRRLERLAADEKPDVIHVHSRRGADRFGGRAARSMDIPAVLTRRVQSREPAFWLRRKCRSYAAIVAISTAVYDELIESGVARNRLKLIPSAVDSSLFRPDGQARSRLIERYGLPPDALIAGAASQLIRRKGLDLLPPLAAKLIATVPNFRLLLFGQGPEEQRLKRLVQQLELEEHVVFCGFDSDWPKLVPGLDLFLHPAHREGLGVAILEAMSAGVAVVASAAGGIVDLIEDGVDGRTATPADVDVWHKVVIELAQDPDKRTALGEKARRKVEARFTINRMTTSYIDLYRELMARD